MNFYPPTPAPPSASERIVTHALEILAAREWDGEDAQACDDALQAAIDDYLASPPLETPGE